MARFASGFKTLLHCLWRIGFENTLRRYYGFVFLPKNMHACSVLDQSIVFRLHQSRPILSVVPLYSFGECMGFIARRCGYGSYSCCDRFSPPLSRVYLLPRVKKWITWSLLNQTLDLIWYCSCKLRCLLWLKTLNNVAITFVVAKFHCYCGIWLRLPIWFCCFKSVTINFFNLDVPVYYNFSFCDIPELIFLTPQAYPIKTASRALASSFYTFCLTRGYQEQHQDTRWTYRFSFRLKMTLNCLVIVPCP